MLPGPRPCYADGMVGISIADLIEHKLWNAETWEERVVILRQFGATDEEIEIVREAMDEIMAEGVARVVDFE